MNPSQFDITSRTRQADTRGFYSAFSHPRAGQPQGYNPHTHRTHALLNNPRARHADYINRNNRLYSFTTWQYPHIQDPAKLVNLGFFYTGEGDLVRCHYCSLGLKDFIKTDDPLREHIRYSGNCEFLVELLGHERLREIKNSLRAESGVIQRGGTFNTGEISPNTQNTSAKNQNQDTQSKPQTAIPRYRHPQYSSYEVRVSSYNGWPTHLVQTPQSLAEAGFYYTGTRDIVRCFACDGGLQKWDPTDDPWIEHCINFPTCVYLKQTKGDDYIALSQTHHQQPKVLIHGAPALNINGSQANGHEIKEQTRHPATNKGVVVNTLTEMGFKKADIDMAIIILKTDKKDISVDAVIAEIQKDSGEAEETPKRTQKELKEERDRLLSQLYCIQCKTSEINSLFLPCQHHRFCTTCSENMTECPVCGCHIAHKIKTYRP